MIVWTLYTFKKARQIKKIIRDARILMPVSDEMYSSIEVKSVKMLENSKKSIHKTSQVTK